jgi:hypothetical protein
MADRLDRIRELWAKLSELRDDEWKTVRYRRLVKQIRAEVDAMTTEEAAAEKKDDSDA